jgi:hypothetical protein
VAVLVAEEAARPLREHVAGEEQAADQAAECVRLGRAGQESDVVLDHPGDDRAGEGAVGRAHRPAEQQPEPQSLVVDAAHGDGAGGVTCEPSPAIHHLGLPGMAK